MEINLNDTVEVELTQRGERRKTMEIKFDKEKFEELKNLKELRDDQALLGSVYKWHPDNNECGSGLCMCCVKWKEDVRNYKCPDCPVKKAVGRCHGHNENNPWFRASDYTPRPEAQKAMYDLLVKLYKECIEKQESGG